MASYKIPVKGKLGIRSGVSKKWFLEFVVILKKNV